MWNICVRNTQILCKMISQFVVKEQYPKNGKFIWLIALLWLVCFFKIKLANYKKLSVLLFWNQKEWNHSKKIHSKKSAFFPDIKVKGLFLKAKSLDKIQISIPVFFNHLLTVASSFMHDWPIRSVVRWYSDAAFRRLHNKNVKSFALQTNLTFVHIS